MEIVSEAVDRHLAKPFWPWSLALAYCQPSQHRDAALAAVVGAIDTCAVDGKGSGEFCGATCLHVIFEVVEGARQSSVDWQRFEEIENRLLGSLQAGSIDGFGRRTADGPFEPIAVLDWLGGEVGGYLTCDLVNAGWRSMPLLEQTLHGNRVVRFYDIHLKGDAVRQLAQAIEDRVSREETWAGDTFAPYLASASKPREGFWSAWATLAWIASRDDRFTAAAQAFEEDAHANRGHAYSAAAWMTLGDEAGELHGCTFSSAESTLREGLEAGRLMGGIAVSDHDGSTAQIERWQWTRWRLAFEMKGLSLLPGYVDFRWPSELVRAAFPDGQADPLATPPNPPKNEKRAGRKRGAGRFMHSDPKFVNQMCELIANREVGSIEEAARKQWPECGGQSEDAAAKRLRRKYLESHSVS